MNLQIGGQRRDPGSIAGRLAFGRLSPLFSLLNTLVVGTRNYRLLGVDDELKGLAGRTVTITGEQFRSDVTVSAIEPFADGDKAKDQR